MTVREVLRLLERDGWFEVRQAGSHRIFRHPTKPGILVVPVHPGRDLATGTLASILKKGGDQAMTSETAGTRYAVVIERAERNYSAYVPDLPGVVAVGVTIDEVRQAIAEAVELYRDEARGHGEPMPEAKTVVESVFVA